MTGRSGGAGSVSRYEEVQRFPPAVEALVGGLALFLAGCLVSDVAFHHPVGDRPAPPAMLVVMLAAFALLYLLMFRLVVRVEDDAVTVEFGYLGLVKFRWRRDQIRDCRATTYRPLAEFGGWGIRFGVGGRRCYNARGNRGVLLETDKRQVIIGSRQPEALAQAIREMAAGGG